MCLFVRLFIASFARPDGFVVVVAEEPNLNGAPGTPRSSPPLGTAAGG
jgi:hypothetical protein